MRISDWSSDGCSSDLDKAVESAPDAKLREQYELSIRAVAAFERFKAVCDARLGVAGPSLNTLLEALKRIVQILGKAARAKGLLGAEEAVDALGEGGEVGDGASAAAFTLGGGATATTDWKSHVQRKGGVVRFTSGGRRRPKQQYNLPLR